MIQLNEFFRPSPHKANNLDTVPFSQSTVRKFLPVEDFEIYFYCDSIRADFQFAQEITHCRSDGHFSTFSVHEDLHRALA